MDGRKRCKKKIIICKNRNLKVLILKNKSYMTAGNKRVIESSVSVKPYLVMRYSVLYSFIDSLLHITFFFNSV